MEKLIACSPNISEGQDIRKIKQILRGVEKNKKLKLLKAHSFKNYNRTEVLFMGEPEEVKTAAIDVVRRTAKQINMKNHAGDHPRIGGIDVLPFIPVKNTDIGECTAIAHEVGKTIGKNLNIPVFYYGRAAKREEYRDLSNLRDEEYEGLKQQFDAKEIEPDDGPGKFNDKMGIIAIGARPGQINFKITINTNNIDIADKVAKIIRESGIEKEDGTSISGKLKETRAVALRGASGEKAYILLVLTDTEETPLHAAFIEAKKRLMNINYDIESTEIQSFLMKEDLVKAGKHFAVIRNKDLTKEKDLIKFALDEMKVRDFNVKKKLIDA